MLKPGCMLEHPCIRRYSFLSHPVRTVCAVSSDNPTGADNQQETANIPLAPQWIIGFVDGEGCFCVSIHRNPYVRQTRGWQLHPVFQVYQHERHRAVLEELRAFFGCGTIRAKGPKSSVLTFAVDGLRDLEAVVLPFFEQHPLRVKGDDFNAFAVIVRAMRQKEHLTSSGFERLVRLAYGMNAVGKQRVRPLDVVLMGSSETARQAPPVMAAKRQSDLYGDMQNQAEMSWSPVPAAEPEESGSNKHA